MAGASVANENKVVNEYRLDEDVRRSLLPPTQLSGLLSALEASSMDHPEICADIPRNAAVRILKRDLAAAEQRYGKNYLFV